MKATKYFPNQLAAVWHNLLWPIKEWPMEISNLQNTV